MLRTRATYLSPSVARLDAQAAHSQSDSYQSFRGSAFRFLRGRTVGSSDYLLIRGDLDLATEQFLIKTLDHLSSGTGPLVIDLKRVTYIDCASLRILVRFQRALSKVRDISLDVGKSGPVRRLIAHFDLDRLLPLGDSELVSVRYKGGLPLWRSLRGRSLVESP